MTNRKRHIAVLVGVIICVAVPIIVTLGRSMTQVASDMSILQKELSGDQRFQNVIVEVVQEESVKSLVVAGVVTSDADLQEMKSKIASKGLKSRISYWMFVRPKSLK